MSGENFIQLAQLGTILLGFLGVAVTLRSHRRQMHAQMYIEFSSRLHHVLRALPAQTWMANARADNVIPPRTDDLTKSCLQCFHIIADLYHLHKGGYISRDLWRPWQRGIRKAMQGPVLRREWLAAEAAFNHDPELCRYFQALIGETS
ncbi:MAG: hypothetical protein C5B51_13145 [Terriglobia bacterium]|nr:MAG: hypothetical protein C5B51_13145 [Terriglobia bacterium]